MSEIEDLKKQVQKYRIALIREKAKKEIVEGVNRLYQVAIAECHLKHGFDMGELKKKIEQYHARHNVKGG